MAGESGSSLNPERDPLSTSPSPIDRSSTPRRILIIEDNKADVFLIRKALAEAGVSAHLHEVDDGERALHYFENADANPEAFCPDLVLLDINMPRFKGGDILHRLRTTSRCREAIVLVVTSSDSDQDRREMERLGANGYFRKPSEFKEFMKLGPLVRELLG